MLYTVMQTLPLNGYIRVSRLHHWLYVKNKSIALILIDYKLVKSLYNFIQFSYCAFDSRIDLQRFHIYSIDIK